MGKEADHIFETFGLNDEDQKKFDTVLAKFDSHFIPKRNIIHECALFNHELAEHCDYGDQKDALIRDRLVIGIKDREVSKELQLKSGLTLETAVQTVRQAEMVNTQMSELSIGPKTNVNEVATREVEGLVPKDFVGTSSCTWSRRST
jgi:hypothetical protein